jgi:hypothetical protein
MAEQRKQIKEVAHLITDFIAAPDWLRAFIIQHITQKQTCGPETKTFLANMFTRLAGSKEEYDRLLGLPFAIKAVTDVEDAEYEVRCQGISNLTGKVTTETECVECKKGECKKGADHN